MGQLKQGIQLFLQRFGGGMHVVRRAAGVLAAVFDPEAVRGLPALIRLIVTSVALGATFLGLGYAISARSRRPSGAAGMAIGLWLVAVVLYDLGLLAAVIADNGGAFTRLVFPLALLANPADAFRLYNLAASEATAAASILGSHVLPISVPMLKSGSSPSNRKGICERIEWQS